MSKLREFIERNKEMWENLSPQDREIFIRGYKRSRSNQNDIREFEHIKEILSRVLKEKNPKL